MAQRSQTGKDDGVDALLNAEIPRLSKCLRAEELTEVSEQYDGDGRKQALEKAEAVYEENAVLRDKITSLKQQLDDYQNENKSLTQRLEDFDFKVGMRQVHTFFRKKHGRAIDVHLMASARYFSDFGTSTFDCFSGQVIDLATQWIKLRNDLGGPLSYYDRARFKRQMTAVTRKLNTLKTVAKQFKTSEMTWGPSIGEGVFEWCFLVAEANKACHRDLTEEFLDAMLGHALRGECVSGGFDFGDAASAVIEKLRIPFRHHAAQI